MGWFFARDRTFLEPQQEVWHIEAWHWLIDGLGGIDALGRAPFVLPTRSFFPPTLDAGAALVTHVFAQIKQLAGMGALACELVAQPDQPQLRVGEFAVLHQKDPAPAGTFGLEGNTPAITYDPSLAEDPIKLVAVLAHELAHLRLSHFPSALAGGRDANERATDLATVALGFGIFGANCAFMFERYQDPISQGWRTARLGYLGEREWAFAIAVWLELTRRELRPVEKYLKPHLVSDVKSAQRSLEQRANVLAPLRLQ